MGPGAGKRNKKESESAGTSSSSTPRSDPPFRNEPQAFSFTWIDDSRTSSASGGRRGVRRNAQEHDQVRRHAATVSAAARLATIRKRNLTTEKPSSSPTRTVYGIGLHKRLSVSSQANITQGGSVQSTDNTQPWYVLRLLGQQSTWYQDAVTFNSVNQKS